MGLLRAFPKMIDKMRSSSIVFRSVFFYPVHDTFRIIVEPNEGKKGKVGRKVNHCTLPICINEHNVNISFHCYEEATIYGN